MVMRVTFSGSQQIIEELCEHCNEFVNQVHISEITTKRETDPRTIRISSSDAVIEVKPKAERVEEIKKERFNELMLSSSVDDEGTAVTESLKYELRSEKMCSSSTNTDIAEFCYRTENTKFLQKTIGSLSLSQSFHSASVKRNEITGGFKMGVDRRGNVIRMKSESIGGVKKYYGAWKKQWYRETVEDDPEAGKQLLSDEEQYLDIDSELVLEKFQYKEGFEKDVVLKATGSVYQNNFSIALDGTNDFIDLDDCSATLHFSDSAIHSHGLTVAAWVYITDQGSVGHPILTIGRTHNKYYGTSFHISATYKLMASAYGQHTDGTFGQSANHRKSVVSADVLKQDQWMFLTWVWPDFTHTNWKLYLNGEEINTITSGNANVRLTYNGNSQMGKLGKVNQAAETFMDGNISNVGVWRTALDEKAVASIFNDGNPLNYQTASIGYRQTGSLVCYWQMEEGEGVGTAETVAGRHTGRLTNGAAFSDLTQNAP